MAITISGENNNDRILASDGVIDSLSGFNVVGVITATSFTGGLTGDVTGNLTGNVTGNINNSTLLLQTGGTERVRITSGGQVGINEASNINGRLHVQHDALAENILYATRYNSQSTDKPILAITEAQMTGMSSPGLVIGNHNRDIHIGSAFGSSAQVVAGASGLRITLDGNVQINQDIKFLQIGAGQDLDLHHNGTNSYIRNKTGNLHIRPLVNEEGIILKPNGTVELYWDNVKKFETYQYGIKSPGHIVASSDGYGFYAGAGFDIEMLHDGSNSRIKNVTGNLEFQEHTSSGDIIFKTTTSGSERLRITSAGQVQINGDGGSAALTLGASQDFRLYHDANGPTIFSDNNNQGLKLSIKELNLTEYTGVTTRLKITSDGDIQVGSFTIVDTRNTGGIHIQPNHGISFRAYGSASDSRNWRIRSDDAGWGNLDFSVGDNNTTDIGNGAADAVLSLAANHNIGINNVAPDQRLKISGNIETNAYDSAGGSGGYYTAKGLIIGNAYDAGKTSSDDRNAIIWNERGLDLDIATNNTLAIKIKHDGTIKIGNTSGFTATDIPLQVHNPLGSSSQMQFTGTSTGATTTSRGFRVGYNGSGGQLWNFENNYIRFATNNTERLQITSGGTIRQTGGDIVIDNTNNGYGGLRIVDDSGGDYTVNYITGRNQGATAHVFKRSGRVQNQIPWANSGGDIEIARISRGGIAFGGDTAAANTLDDYEEGSFTPALTGFSSISYHRQNGFYTKIGRMVYVHVYLYVYQATGDGNTVTVTGLPFTSTTAGNSRLLNGGSITYQNGFFSSSFNDNGVRNVYIGAGHNYVSFHNNINGSSIGGNGTHLGAGANNRYLNFVAQYMTDT